MVYLVMTVVWALAAAAVFAYEWQTGDVSWRLFGGPVSSGWIMLLFAVYNAARWYSGRADRAARDAALAARQRQQDEARRREPRGEPDPTFDFTDRKD